MDVVKVQLFASPAPPSAAIGYAGSVSLAYENQGAGLVFTSQVEAVRRSIKGIRRFTATNGGAMLAKLKANHSYEDQKAGDIVKGLAGQLRVGTGSVAVSSSLLRRGGLRRGGDTLTTLQNILRWKTISWFSNATD